MTKIDIVRKGTKVNFTPKDAVVPRNDSVFWHNADSVAHQISLNGQIVPPGQTSSEVLITANRVYSCLLHSGETGSITIQTIAARGPTGAVALAVGRKRAPIQGGGRAGKAPRSTRSRKRKGSGRKKK
jgi:hypothetical protein